MCVLLFFVCEVGELLVDCYLSVGCVWEIWRWYRVFYLRWIRGFVYIVFVFYFGRSCSLGIWKGVFVNRIMIVRRYWRLGFGGYEY